jgi:serine/threonine-protein kinase RsbW
VLSAEGSKEGHANSRKAWSFSIPSERERIHQVLKATESWLKEHRFPTKEVHDITLAVIEAVMNAIIYGNEENPRKKVDLSYSLTGGKLVITIADHGKDFRPPAGETVEKPSLNVHGRGIPIMRALMDEVKFEKLSRGKRVRLIKYRKRDE